MLKCLTIENYALIDHLTFKPESGFVVITGETGAGKSIIMGALGLILGNRADAKCLKDQEKKCVIEGVFDITHLQLEAFFNENDLDYEGTCIIRREIAPSGKSRSFINDTPVTLQQLKSITELLIDVHSQHQNLLIKDKHFHLSLLDIWGNNEELLSQYQASFHLQKKCKSALEAKQEELAQKVKDRDYIAFQYTQLNDAKLTIGEQEELEQELQELEHAEEIKRVLTAAEQALGDEETGVQNTIRESRSQFHKIAHYHSKYAAHEERLNSIYLELEDLTSEIEHTNQDLIFDADHLEYVNQRLDLIYSLQQKHHVDSIADLLALHVQFETTLRELDDSDSVIEDLKKEYESIHLLTQKQAEDLTIRRKAAVPEIQEAVIVLLKQLGMPNVQLQIEVQRDKELSVWGQDDVQMLFAANKGSKLNKVEDTASGGEIARLLLSVKAVMARKKKLSSIIFDEIDTGVSGEIAHRMGEIMREMSKSMQVICITHLPQIGARGTTHFKVYKKVEEHHTHTDIIQLNAEERIKEIAYMLSGEQLTSASLDNARELLK